MPTFAIRLLLTSAFIATACDPGGQRVPVGPFPDAADATGLDGSVSDIASPDGSDAVSDSALPDVVPDILTDAEADPGGDQGTDAGQDIPPVLGSGFASAPVAWVVPDTRFNAAGGSVQLQGENWTTMDMNGDRRPDLVWAGDGNAHTDAGANWRVYLNQ